MSLLSLENKVAFIPGSPRGIGWATAQLFSEHGATIILNGHSNPSLFASPLSGYVTGQVLGADGAMII